eukprot:TRINITY_DN66089_c5_g2_i1.p1 TRINITY_DN66089_c5_g2~~TRINITY_DN66089_c5_g2_i1.p1  ORF type:complete len:349 (-),score=178.64 TRINITY_DN66089_c5_g2_i1:32-1078(-)
MDAEYLKANVGTALSLGLVEVMHSQPADPVEFLSQFLFRHATSQRAQQQADSHARLLERADAVLEQREAERLKAEQDEQEKRQAEEKMAQSREEMFEQRLGQTGSVEEVWRAAVERVSECVGEMDSAVYVAELLGDEAQRLAYFMTSPGQEFMLENALEREQGPVTFDKLFPEDEEEEEEDEEALRRAKIPEAPPVLNIPMAPPVMLTPFNSNDNNEDNINDNEISGSGLSESAKAAAAAGVAALAAAAAATGSNGSLSVPQTTAGHTAKAPSLAELILQRKANLRDAKSAPARPVSEKVAQHQTQRTDMISALSQALRRRRLDIRKQSTFLLNRQASDEWSSDSDSD